MAIKINRHSPVNTQMPESIAENEAARYLGVDVGTLRVWAEAGFIKQAVVKPVSRYRKTDVLALQKRLMGC